MILRNSTRNSIPCSRSSSSSDMTSAILAWTLTLKKNNSKQFSCRNHLRISIWRSSQSSLKIPHLMMKQKLLNSKRKPPCTSMMSSMKTTWKQSVLQQISIRLGYPFYLIKRSSSIPFRTSFQKDSIAFKSLNVGANINNSYCTWKDLKNGMKSLEKSGPSQKVTP